MNITSNLREILVAVSLSWMVGCATEPPAEPSVPAPAPLPPSVDTSHPRARLVIGSDQLLGLIQLRNPAFRKVGTLTQTQVEIVNISSGTIDLQYLVEWRDEQGFKAGSVTSWQALTIAGRTTEYVTSMGKVPEAYQITVTVKLRDDFFSEPPPPPVTQKSTELDNSSK